MSRGHYRQRDPTVKTSAVKCERETSITRPNFRIMLSPNKIRVASLGTTDTEKCPESAPDSGSHTFGPDFACSSPAKVHIDCGVG